LRELLERLLAGAAPGRQPLTHVENLPARAASTASITNEPQISA